MSGKSPSVSLSDNQLARLVKESAHQVWLAGLGAYAKAEQEGSRLFDGLVSIGERIEKEARDQVGRRVEAAERKVTDVRQTALLTWDRIETLVENQIGATLNRLQIPTSRDIRELSRRVEALQSAVERLEAERPAPAAARKKAAARHVTKKAAPRKAPARKRAARPAAGRVATGARGRKKTTTTRASGS